MAQQQQRLSISYVMVAGIQHSGASTGQVKYPAPDFEALQTIKEKQQDGHNDLGLGRKYALRREYR